MFTLMHRDNWTDGTVCATLSSMCVCGMRWGRKQRSVDARDESPHMFEQTRGSQLGKLHRAYGGGTGGEGRRGREVYWPRELTACA